MPSSASYTVPDTVSGYASSGNTNSQNFNPSSTTSWQVFSNDGTNVEIISVDSVGELSLAGSTAYINLVQTLNDISMAYVNPTYAISGRSLGYYDEKLVNSYGNLGNVMTEEQQNNYKTVDIDVYPFDSGVSGLPHECYQYKPDMAVLTNNGSMYHSYGYVWLASRGMSSGETINYYANRLSTTGTTFSQDLYIMYFDDDNGASDGAYSGVRPIVTLKPTVTILGGSGTKSDPYIINTSNPAQYTVTYCANGGYGEMMPQTVLQGSGVILTENTYKHHNKTFVRWSTSATTVNETFTDEQSMLPKKDITLYAIWL